jgi:hypothetical protein
MRSSLFAAIDFVRTELRVPVSRLLPYPALLVPLTYFFHKTKNKKPNNIQARRLEQFFYWVGLNERYGSASDSKISEDFNKIDAIAKGKNPKYFNEELSIETKLIKEAWFSAGDAYCKTILCLLAYQQPKSFDTNGVVILSNDNLKIASSRNYHHFFPKAYLAKHMNDKEPNLIANITLIDDSSNKSIGKKAPSEYIQEFREDNNLLAKTLKTHLISNIKRYGIETNDYDKFIEQRANAIALALNEKLNPFSAIE